MFTSDMTEQEKEAFVSLAYHAAEVNGIITDEESHMLESYVKDVKKENIAAENLMSMEEVTKIFSASEEKHKKGVLLELLSLMYIDRGYDYVEKGFVADFAGAISVDEDSLKKIENAVIKYREACEELAACLM